MDRMEKVRIYEILRESRNMLRRIECQERLQDIEDNRIRSLSEIAKEKIDSFFYKRSRAIEKTAGLSLLLIAALVAGVK